jgi:signal transduction histidine kinase
VTDESDLQRENATLRQRIVQLEVGAVSSDRTMLTAAEELGRLGAFVWDSETGRVVASSGLVAILGRSPAQMTSLEEGLGLVHVDDRKRLARLARLALCGSDVERAQFRLAIEDGSVLHVVARVSVELSESGALRSLRGAVMDITERRELEGQLLQSQKMEAVGTLAGGVAHDFNNFLQVIEGHSDLMCLDADLPEKTRYSIEEIRAAIQSCRQLTQRLLAFGRKNEGVPTINDVRQLLGSTTRMLRRLIGEDIALTIATDPDPCTIRIDPVQFEQILVNLAVNARDAMPDGGTLEIRAERIVLNAAPNPRHGLASGLYCRIKVTDSGIGMTNDVIGRIFEPFFTTKPSGKGTGLGLSTVHGIVHQAHGVISVESRVEVGTCFTVLFPASVSEQAMPRVRVDSRDFPTGTETVLLVEDGEDVRTITQKQLERAGYVVLSAANGEAALALADAHEGPIHLLITDVMMPRMSGPELAGRLQEQRTGATVIFMSGYTERLVLRRTSLRSDRVSLHKPFSMLELLCCVREQLDQLRTP